MAYDAQAEARSILDAIQAGVDSSDAAALHALFDESAVLIGSTADSRDRAAVTAYLDAVAAGDTRWDWEDVAPFHVEERSLGFGAFGTATSGGLTVRLRATLFAVGGPGSWRLRQFHGSVAWSPPP